MSLAVFAEIELVAFDIDGTLTDGTTTWLGPEIGWTQTYSTRDGESILRLVRMGIAVVPVSRNKTACARARMDGLGLRLDWLGVSDKVEAIRAASEALHVSLPRICFLGDGLEDASVFEVVGCPCAVADGHPRARAKALFVTRSKGGERAFEELTFRILDARGGVGMIAIGIMSGTSCDGADAIAIRLRSTSEPHEPEVVAHAHEPYPDSLREVLLEPERILVPQLAELHYALPEVYARAALKLGVGNDAAVCGVHGQTVWHAPPSKRPRVAATLQIGSSAVLAHRLGIPVVGDLRGADIAEGGEGAPIVPLSHWFFTPQGLRPRAVVNVGGIANVTLVAEQPDDVIGFDAGPGMMLVDAFARIASKGTLDCDRDGVLSHGGRVDGSIVAAVLGHPFVAASPPKSTGREDFGAAFFEPIFTRFASLPSADVMSSLVCATAEAIVLALGHASFAPREIVLTGGGAKNPTLLAHLRQRVTVPVRVVTEGVLLPDHHEPAAVALIAARTLEGLTSSLPRVTGARSAARLGHIHYP